MAEDEKQEGLDTLIPDREVQLSTGEKVTVRPLMFMQIAKGARHIEGVIHPALASGVLSEEGDLNVSALAGLLAAAGEHVYELIMLCTYKANDDRIDRAWLSTVSIEDGIELAKAVLMVNWRESIVKKLETLNQEVQGYLQATTGSTSSSA